MVIEQLQGLHTIFTRRFLFNALLPTLIFVSVDAAAVILFMDAWPTTSAWWGNLDLPSQAILAISYLAAIWFLAVAVASQWRGIVRLYEGYPALALCSWLHIPAPGVTWHRDRLRTLQGSDPYSVYTYYPGQRYDDVLPTRLGNILRAAEKYPIDRYGIDPIIYWPRLYPFLPEAFQRDFEEFTRDYEFPLVVSILSLGSGVLCGVAALLTGQRPIVFIAVVVGLFAVAYGAYLVAIPGAVEMAEQQRVAFDLYRGLILEAWPTVEDVQDDGEAYEAITDFVVQNANPRWSAAQTRHRERSTGQQPPNPPDQGR
ncbi:hypothetical protein [Fodinicola acaciae]|uniref:hypothetical protein n=1 Tax=Fodinicola acaciae TaxID=2681555 RepID=UPI0013D565D6|nr:hypothetical protein [Fodinicola acaciae]